MSSLSSILKEGVEGSCRLPVSGGFKNPTLLIDKREGFIALSMLSFLARGF